MSAAPALASISELIELRGSGPEPCVAGTGVTVGSIGRLWIDGLTAAEIADEYPALHPEQIHAAIAFYLYNRRAIDSALERDAREYDEAAEAQRLARQAGDPPLAG